MSILPPRLAPGMAVGLVSPSWGGAGLFPHRVQAAARQLERLGYSLRPARHALNSISFVSDTPEHRAADLHELFLDPAVGAIISAIGGDHSCHLLPLLDFDLIRSQPKIFCGFSDVSVLEVAIWAATGLVTFNGPAVLTDFGEYPAMLDYTRENWLNLVTRPVAIGGLLPSPFWTEESQAWQERPEQSRPRGLQPSPGWTWLKPGRAQGVLLGGCIESLDHLRGTRFWPDWQDAIFFFETSEDKPSPERVDSLLMDYENMGVLARIKGLLVGRPMRYSDAEKEQLRQVLLERTRRYDFPILADMDFGHTSPMLTLPIGVRARIDSSKRCFEIIEPAVR
jgi:muramoyltetrapeptide carboxypeptidase